jgi:hypothetical protein
VSVFLLPCRNLAYEPIDPLTTTSSSRCYKLTPCSYSVYSSPKLTQPTLAVDKNNDYEQSNDEDSRFALQPASRRQTQAVVVGTALLTANPRPKPPLSRQHRLCGVIDSPHVGLELSAFTLDWTSPSETPRICLACAFKTQKVPAGPEQSSSSHRGSVIQVLPDSDHAGPRTRKGRQLVE